MLEETQKFRRRLFLRSVPHSRVAGLLAAADLFVLPSRREGFPMVLLEAGVLGNPVVATDVGEIAELITDGRDGWFVPPENPDLLAMAIESALAHREELLRRAQCLQSRVLETFTWARAGAEYSALSGTPFDAQRAKAMAHSPGKSSHCSQREPA